MFNVTGSQNQSEHPLNILTVDQNQQRRRRDGGAGLCQLFILLSKLCFPSCFVLQCCPGNCPPCDQSCGRTLGCRNHKCPSGCHQGNTHTHTHTHTRTHESAAIGRHFHLCDLILIYETSGIIFNMTSQLFILLDQHRNTFLKFVYI